MIILQSIGTVFLQVANSYRILLEKKMNAIGLHYGQISVLDLLWIKDGLSQIEISKQLRLTQPTVNKMVKSLEQNLFIQSNQCPDDGRIMRVSLTQKGLDAREFVLIEIEILQNEFFVKLTETEKLIFKQICDKLNENCLN